jgi:hypothetical protein
MNRTKIASLAKCITIVALAGLFCSCEKQENAPVAGTPVVVGTKNDLYEVLAKNQLKLAPGANSMITPGPNGKGSGLIIFMKNNNSTGYAACGCVGATTNNCTASSDNPDNNPTCSGSCTDSEGNAHDCSLENLPGPPKDPPQYWLRKSTL